MRHHHQNEMGPSRRALTFRGMRASVCSTAAEPYDAAKQNETVETRDEDPIQMPPHDWAEARSCQDL